ncbi:hypothetical protein [Planococcus sp. MB-3u-03]|uniref:hypothetical protein n=1 Tax=Planococcus sp. MB-3u-03 TaxID=2058136 RepID=UPI001E32C6E9|nr:hypothetical protein [Planococcus sp. MB-3u-03]
MNIRKADHSDLNAILTLSPQAIYDGTLGEVMPSNEKSKVWFSLYWKRWILFYCGRTR